MGDWREGRRAGSGREAILAALEGGERSVAELAVRTGLSQPNVSNHLARLLRDGRVRHDRRGRQVFYRLAAAPPQGEHPEESGAPVLSARRNGPPAAPEVLLRFWPAAFALREEEAVRTAEEALDAGLPWQELYLHVLTPTLVRVGELWEQGELGVAREHLVTATVARILHRLADRLPAGPLPSAPLALVGCVAGEQHTLGSQMAADFLRSQGWRTAFLNGALPVEEWLTAVAQHLPQAVVLCITQRDRGAVLEESVERLARWRGEQPLPLLVAGGRYFLEGEEAAAPPGLDFYGADLEGVTHAMTQRILELRRGPEPPEPRDTTVTAIPR